MDSIVYEGNKEVYNSLSINNEAILSPILYLNTLSPILALLLFCIGSIFIILMFACSILALLLSFDSIVVVDSIYYCIIFSILALYCILLTLSSFTLYDYYDINKTIFKDAITKDMFKIISSFRENNNDIIYVSNIKDELDTYKIKIDDFIRNFIPYNR